MDMAYKIGDVARLAGVSVRTLHHYDDIGLLRPSQRSDSGYRLYTEADLERLQQVLFYRELGFALDDIRDIVSAPDFDRYKALIAQRGLLRQKADHIQAVLALIDKTINSVERGLPMNQKDMFEVFGDFEPTQYQEEAENRWGDTAAYAEAARRTRRYDKATWQTIRDEGDAINKKLAAALAAGTPAEDPAVLDLAEEHRLHIDKWFYPCSHEMHRALGRMYVDDARFARFYERYHPGLAAFLRDAIIGNAARPVGKRKGHLAV